MNITNCNEICNYVKRFRILSLSRVSGCALFALCTFAGSSGLSSAAAQSLPSGDNARRQVFLPPRISAAYYPLFEKAVVQSSLWQGPLPIQGRQIVRLQHLSFQTQTPDYVSEQNVRPEFTQLSMTLTHEVWRRDELIWVETLTRSQHWQKPGYRALSVGQSPTQHLLQLPRGSFNPLNPVPEIKRVKKNPFEPFIFHQITHTLTQDYLTWKQKQQEQPHEKR